MKTDEILQLIPYLDNPFVDKVTQFFIRFIQLGYYKFQLSNTVFYIRITVT